MTIKSRRITASPLFLAALIGLALLAAGAAGAATWFLMPPPKIVARTQLYVGAIPPAILFPERNQLNAEAFLQSQAYLIKDRFLLNAVLRENPELAELSLIKEQPDPLQWLEKEITVSFPSPEVMNISLGGDRPDEQKKIVSAVTRTYLENFVNKQHTNFLMQQHKLKEVLIRMEERTKRKRAQLRILQKNNAPINEEGMTILQQVALSEKKAVIQELTQLHMEIRRLQTELSLHPDMQKQETLQLLKAMEKVHLEDAARLDEETKQNRREAVDLAGPSREIEQDEEFMRQVNDKLMRMDVEQEAPLRITQPDKEAVLFKPDETKSNVMVTAAVGLGILLLALAVFTLLAHQANKLAEHSPTPSLPD